MSVGTDPDTFCFEVRPTGGVNSVTLLTQLPPLGSVLFERLGTTSTKYATSNMLWGEDEAQKTLRRKFLTHNFYDPLEVTVVWISDPRSPEYLCRL
jgi:hypothetical protein